MTTTLQLSELSAAIERGDYPELPDEAVAGLYRIPPDHCFVTTGELHGKEFPSFMVSLSTATARFCGLTSHTPPEPNFKFIAYQDKQGNMGLETILLFDKGRSLHLSFDPAHPSVRQWLRLATETPVFGITYAMPNSDQLYSGYNEMDEDQATWFTRNLPKAEALPPTNTITGLVLQRIRSLKPTKNHRFLTFAEAPEADDLPEWLTADEDDYALAWLAEEHGIALTLSTEVTESEDFINQVLSISLELHQQPRELFKRYQELDRAYPDRPLLLRALAMTAGNLENEAVRDRYTERLRQLQDRSLTHRLYYLETLHQAEQFRTEMERFPRPHSLLDHPPQDEQGRYDLEDFITHEVLATHYECTIGQLNEAVLRVDRLVRLGVSSDRYADALSSIVISRMGRLDPDRDMEVLLTYTDIPAAVRRQLHADTLPLLQDHVVVIMEEFMETMPVEEPVRRAGRKVGRNEPCPCGSGRKYKRCCG